MASKAREAFRTISEVADWLDVPAHVLRFWESKFSQIKPVKRAGGRRYYRPDDMLLIGGIKKLLHDDGMTIRGVQKVLKEDGIKSVSEQSQPLDGVDESASERTVRRKAAVADIEDAVEQDAGSTDSTTPPPEAPAELPAEDQEAVDAWNADAAQEATPDTAERPSLDIAATTDDTQDEDGTGDAETEPMKDPMPEDTHEDVPEAPFIEVEEEEPQFGGDNVVELASRTEPDPVAEEEPALEAASEDVAEATPEPVAEAEPAAPVYETDEPELAFDLAPVEDAVVEPVAEDLEAAPEVEVEAEAELEAAPAQEEPEDAAEAEYTQEEAEASAPELEHEPEVEENVKAEPEPTTAAQPIPDTVEEGFQLSQAQLTGQALKRKLRGNDASTLSAEGVAPDVARLQALRDRLAQQLGQ